jgi:uncharacterized protein YbjT (DUF2867 family)
LAVGEPVRATVRSLAAADLPSGVTVVEADLTEPDTVKAALDGARKVFAYSSPDGAANLADAARATGVEHVVLLSSGSVLLPYAKGNAIAEEHRAVEETLTGSGLRWTPIHPLVLAGNALGWADSIRAEGLVRLFHPDARMAPVHERDIAAVAVAALRDRSGADGLLTGGELLSQRRQVELIGAAVGRTLRVEELSESQARQHFGRFGQPHVVDAILNFIAAAMTGGSPATDTVRRVLGRPPASFARWARDHAADFR